MPWQPREVLIVATRVLASLAAATLGVLTVPAAIAAAEPAPTPEAVAACTQFAHALDMASLSYQGFANGLALGDTHSDPALRASNVTGRTGLRQAVSTALEASRIPGVAPDITAPMRSWSLSATKLMLLMGVRADVDRFNATATDLNTHTEAAQSACAAAGTRA